MTLEETKEYQRLRALGWLSQQAHSAAITKCQFDAIGGVRCGCTRNADTCIHCEDAPIRLIAVPDDHLTIGDLEGDIFKAELHPEISAERIERERKEFTERVQREGVFGLVGQYHDGDTWETVDSCWGFLGDDLIGNGYDLDIMAATLECVQPIPDAWMAL